MSTKKCEKIESPGDSGKTKHSTVFPEANASTKKAEADLPGSSKLDIAALPIFNKMKKSTERRTMKLNRRIEKNENDSVFSPVSLDDSMED